MTLDPSRVTALTGSGRRTAATAVASDDPVSTERRSTPRTRPYRLTVDLPPAVHTQLSRWVIDLEEQAGHNVDKRAVVLALLDLLHRRPRRGRRSRRAARTAMTNPSVHTLNDRTIR